MDELDAGLRVAVWHPEALGRDVLGAALSGAGLQVVAAADELHDLVRRCRETGPDAVVVYVSRKPEERPVIRRLRGTPVVLLVDHDALPVALSLLHSGASGCVAQDAAPAELLAALRAVAGGEAFLTPRAAAMVLNEWRGRRTDVTRAPRGTGEPLTRRELEVLGCMAEGLATKAIARQLRVAAATVDSHKSRIFRKLGARSQAHAITLAVTRGLLDGRESD